MTTKQLEDVPGVLHFTHTHACALARAHTCTHTHAVHNAHAHKCTSTYSHHAP
jgi:hypothetical protein